MGCYTAENAHIPSERMTAFLFSSNLLACVALGLAQEFFFMDTACTSEQTSCGGLGTCKANSKKCSCGAEYTAHGKKCVTRGHMPDYSKIGDCYGGNCVYHGSVCSGKNRSCICSKGKVYTDQHLCTPVYFDTPNCTTPESSCSNLNGECTENGTCLCKENFYAVNKQCVQIKFQQRGGCIQDSICGGLFGKCQADNQTCVCEKNSFADVDGDSVCSAYDFFQFSENCDLTRVTTGTESSGTCGFGNGQCSRDEPRHCTCNPGYIAEGGMCVVRVFKPSDECGSAGTPCDGGYGICIGNGRCKCNEQFFFELDGRCVRAYYRTRECLYTDVTKSKPCGHGLGRCYAGTCYCFNESWFQEEQNGCVSGTFHEPSCKSTGQRCSSVGNGICLRAKTCRCQRGYYSDVIKDCVIPSMRRDITRKFQSSNLACVSVCLNVWVAIVSINIVALVQSRQWQMTSM